MEGSKLSQTCPVEIREVLSPTVECSVGGMLGTVVSADCSYDQSGEFNSEVQWHQGVVAMKAEYVLPAEV
jgi:hypothetical protein